MKLKGKIYFNIILSNQNKKYKIEEYITMYSGIIFCYQGTLNILIHVPKDHRAINQHVDLMFQTITIIQIIMTMVGCLRRVRKINTITTANPILIYLVFSRANKHI